MHVGALELVVALGAVLMGSVVQGSIGFGLNLLAAPLVAIVVPEALPTTLVLVAFPLTITTVAREHHAIDRTAVGQMLVGAVPGTIVGLFIVTRVSTSALATLVGFVVLLGVLLSVVSPPVPVTAVTGALAGFASNIFGTAAAVGGPPVALLFQHRDGPSARSTLGSFFAVSASMSLIGYTIAGTIHGDQALFALALLPAMAAGFWASKHLHVFVDGGWLRPMVLIVSGIAGCVAIARGLL
ncbi:MAG TPA: sulfite exporter TauE/SafE family protein [Acidimicrobiia bacterium]|nr:sulfite exporter TauE/SafE family protein [Acidimicrobiia bacterium]